MFSVARGVLKLTQERTSERHSKSFGTNAAQKKAKAGRSRHGRGSEREAGKPTAEVGCWTRGGCEDIKESRRGLGQAALLGFLCLEFEGSRRPHSSNSKLFDFPLFLVYKASTVLLIPYDYYGYHREKYWLSRSKAGCGNSKLSRAGKNVTQAYIFHANSERQI